MFSNCERPDFSTTQQDYGKTITATNVKRSSPTKHSNQPDLLGTSNMLYKPGYKFLKKNNSKCENIESFLPKFKENHPQLAKHYLAVPLNFDLINLELVPQTEYQNKYCPDLIKEKTIDKEVVPLVDDKRIIQYTTYGSSYRPQNTQLKLEIERSRPISRTFFTLPDEIKQILSKIPNNSTYQDDHGAIGQFIIEESLHGKIRI